MGSYLVVNGIENNSKQASGAMIDLMRNALPDKKSLHGESIFALSPNELAEVTASAVTLARDPHLAVSFVQGVYQEGAYCPFKDKDDMDDIEDTYVRIALIFSQALSYVVMEDAEGVICSRT